MPENKLIERLAMYVISRLLEFISTGGLKILWVDLEHNQVLFQMDPANEQVAAILKAAGQGGAA